MSITVKNAQVLGLDWPAVEALDERGLADFFLP